MNLFTTSFPFAFHDDIWGRYFWESIPSSPSKPPCEVSEVREDPTSDVISGVKLTYALAGFTEEDIGVEVIGRTLHVRGNNLPKEVNDRGRGFSKFQLEFNHSYKIADKLDLESIDVKLENGLLVIFIPLARDRLPERRTLFGSLKKLKK